MRKRFPDRPLAVAIAFLFTLMPRGIGAQTPTATPRYEPPRTPDGRADLQGIWQVVNSASWDVEDHPARMDVPGGQSVVEGADIPYRPAALATRQQNFDNRATADPVSKCYLAGVPRITYMPFPFQIFQTPKQVSILYEYVHTQRNIYIDSQHPKGPINWWMGDSRGHWEGDTLVVDVIHFTDQTWLDKSGNFHSDALHVVERYTRSGPDHMRYEVTIEDPKVFTRPWKMSMPLYRRQEPNVELLEYECQAYLFEDTEKAK